MQNKRFKQTEEALAEIYRNAQLALQSISDILPETEDGEVRAELTAQHEAYEHFSARAQMIARDKGLELKEPNPMKKAMMWGSIKMNAMSDNSAPHIAEMMLQGTLMGITALRKTQSELPPDYADEEVRGLLKDFIGLEERFEKRLKRHL